MRNFLRYFFMLGIILLLWDTLLVQPIQIFASYVHQLGHLLMGFIFSYSHGKDFIVNLTENSYKILNQKSLVSAIFIANAGYILSLIFTFSLLYMKDSASKKYIPGLFAVFFVSIAGLYAGMSRQLLYAAIFAASAVILHMLHKDSLYTWFIEIAAVTNLAYTLYDIAINVVYFELNLHFRFSKWNNGIPYSDAIQLHTLTHIPAVVWGLLWFIAIGFITYMFFRKEKQEDESTETPAEGS